MQNVLKTEIVERKFFIIENQKDLDILFNGKEEITLDINEGIKFYIKSLEIIDFKDRIINCSSGDFNSYCQWIAFKKAWYVKNMKQCEFFLPPYSRNFVLNSKNYLEDIKNQYEFYSFLLSKNIDEKEFKMIKDYAEKNYEK